MPKKVAFEFNPFRETGIKVPDDRKEEALVDIRNFVKETVLSKIGDGESPVAGGKWFDSYTPQYKKIKEKESSSKSVNLELTGEMLDALDVVELNSERLSLQVAGDQAGKADGNNRGTYGKDKPTKRRREFIPVDGKTFSADIWSGIREILEGYSED